MKFKQFVWGAAVAAAVSLGSAPVSAASVSTSQWYTFSFENIGSALVGINPGPTTPGSIAAPAGPWTISLSGAATLTVVDLQASGDVFKLFDTGTSIGSTSTPTADDFVGLDIAAALTNPNFSKGAFSLAAGGHSLTGILGPNSNGFGAGAFIIQPNAVSDVPEPGSFALAGLALLGLSLARRKSA